MTTTTREEAAMEVTIYEQGNGFPEVGNHVPGDDGELYLITGGGSGMIQTGQDGAGSSLAYTVELADWQDVADEDIFPALAILPS